MGLFTPKISQRELQYVQTRLSQLQDSVRLVNSTVKPDVFFKRLHFTLDLLLDLQSYEKYKIFKGTRPSDDYRKIINNLESTVNDFIDRTIASNNDRLSTLKTDKARKKNREEFAVKLISAFDCAHTFWSGNSSQTHNYPHYTGPLFTQNNYKRVQAIYNSLDGK